MFEKERAEREVRVAEFTERFTATGVNRHALDQGEADIKVLQFIAQFIAWHPDDCNDILHKQFASGYCFYFAHILKIAFGRGNIRLAAPYGHIVWVDDNGTAYDIDGVYVEHDVLIPVEVLGEGIEDFMHVPGKEGYCGPEELDRLVKEFSVTEHTHTFDRG